MSRSNHQVPRVFISHRHRDKNIADKVREWIERTSAGRVKVFQSSSYAHGVKIGKPLSQELRDTLWHTDVLILIYTVSDSDWSYCMWECGVATDPESPDTRVVVFQFPDDGPPVFDDLVRVRPRSKDSILQFTSQFLTDPDFCPHKEAITGFERRSTQVHEAAEALSAAIAEIPPTAHEKVEEWPAWPFLKLHIPLHESTRISKLEVSAALPELLRHTVVAATDMVALMILGLRKLPEQETLESIVARIRERSGTIDDRWVTSLVSQMHRALQWDTA